MHVDLSDSLSEETIDIQLNGNISYNVYFENDPMYDAYYHCSEERATWHLDTKNENEQDDGSSLQESDNDVHGLLGNERLYADFWIEGKVDEAVDAHDKVPSLDFKRESHRSYVIHFETSPTYDANDRCHQESKVWPMTTLC